MQVYTAESVSGSSAGAGVLAEAHRLAILVLNPAKQRISPLVRPGGGAWPGEPRGEPDWGPFSRQFFRWLRVLGATLPLSRLGSALGTKKVASGVDVSKVFGG